MRYVLLFFLGLTACSPGDKTAKVTGKDGKDGYSVVTMTKTETSLCSSAGGVEVLLALDLDRSLTFSSSDIVQSQFVVCNGSAGVNGTNGINGKDGTNGVNGTNGSNGLDGQSCTVSKVGAAATISCGSNTVVVSDGTNGLNGNDGAAGAKGDKGDKGVKGDKGDDGDMPSGIFITEIVRPCGNEFPNDEIFLRLSTGSLLALYDGGADQDRLVLLAPGNYITTDRSKNLTCRFTVTANNQLTNERVE